MAISFELPLSESVKVHLKTLPKAPAPNLSPKVYHISDSLDIWWVIFDDRLVFDEHINYVSKKLNQRIGLLSRLRHFLPEKTLIIVFNSIVLLILDYSLIVFGFTYDVHMNRLIVLQKKV